MTATSISDRATEVDTAAAGIVANFWTDPQYRNGMTQAQIDAIVNFQGRLELAGRRPLADGASLAF